MTPSLPPTLGERFQAVRTLGRGTYGVVVQARDLELRRDVAIKLLSPEGLKKQAHRDRLTREARLTAGLTSPYVARLYDFDVEGEHPWILYELVHGEDLDRLLGRLDPGRLPLGDAVRMLQHVLRGLEEAHKIGVLHRDLKPANVMIGDDGRARVIDWGLGRRDEDLTLTSTGALVGTPSTMAPEQMRGEELTPRSDLYAAALTFLHAATGSNPFLAPSLPEVHHRKLQELQTPLAKAGIEAPPGLDAVLPLWLAPEPEDRPADAGTMARELDRALREAPSLEVSFLPEAAPPRPKTPPPRRASATLPAGAVLAGVALIAGAALLNQGPAAPAPRPVAPAAPAVSAEVRAAREALAAMDRALEADPAIAAFEAMTERVSTREALALRATAQGTFRAAAGRHDLRGNAATLGAAPLEREALAVLGRLALRERLLADTTYPRAEPLWPAGAGSPLDPLLQRAATIRSAPTLFGWSDSPWPVRRRAHLEALGEAGGRWEVARDLALLGIQGREELGPVIDVKARNPAGVPFAFPLNQLGAFALDSLYVKDAQERARLAPEDAYCPLREVGGDLELAVILAGWGVARHLVLEFVGRDASLTLPFRPPLPEGAGPTRKDALAHHGYRLRVVREVLPPGLRELRATVQGLQPLGSPRSVLDIGEIYQRVDP